MVLRVRAQMPGEEPPPRPDGWAAGVLGIAVLTLWIGILMPIAACHPRSLTGYPLCELLVCIGVMLVEAIAISLALRARGSASTAVRALACSSAVLFMLLLFAPVAMPSSASISTLILWNALVIAWLGIFGAIRIVLAVLSAIARRLTP